MAEICSYDEDRFYAENGTVGDNFTATGYGKRGDIALRVEEPWAGDTETGFGRVCGFTITKNQAIDLAHWLLEKCAVPEARALDEEWNSALDAAIEAVENMTDDQRDEVGAAPYIRGLRRITMNHGGAPQHEASASTGRLPGDSPGAPADALPPPQLPPSSEGK
jgi:hypothetical protein